MLTTAIVVALIMSVYTIYTGGIHNNRNSIIKINMKASTISYIRNNFAKKRYLLNKSSKIRAK